MIYLNLTRDQTSIKQTRLSLTLNPEKQSINLSIIMQYSGRGLYGNGWKHQTIDWFHTLNLMWIILWRDCLTSLGGLVHWCSNGLDQQSKQHWAQLVIGWATVLWKPAISASPAKYPSLRDKWERLAYSDLICLIWHQEMQWTAKPLASIFQYSKGQNPSTTQA